jgi:hypothetical protein
MNDIRFILNKLLIGHDEIVNKIIQFKKDIETDESRRYHIENNVIDKSIIDNMKIINKIITYPYRLTFYNMDDIYHDDIFTNKFGIILTYMEQMIYLDKIYNNIILPVIVNNDIIFYEYQGYLIKYKKPT